MAMEKVLLYKLSNKLKTQLKVQNYCHPSHYPKPSNGPDWSLCWGNSGPWPLGLTPLIKVCVGSQSSRSW